MSNELSFKLKFQDSGLDNLESVYTEQIKPKYISKEHFTSYTYFDDKNHYFHFDNLIFSINELRSSNLSLLIYDTELKIDEDEEKEKVKDKDKDKEFSIETSLKLKKITPTKTLLNLKKRYNQIGYSYINFYKILSQNDNSIMKTTSKVFQRFSLLYTVSNDTKNNPNLNNLQTNEETKINLLTNMEENNVIPKINSIMSKEIKFQVFDDVSKSFSEKIFFKGAEIGQVNNV